QCCGSIDVRFALYIVCIRYIDTSTTLDNGSTLDLRLLLDTGAALPLLLHANTHPELVVPENVIMGKLGVGLGGVIEGFMGRISSLEFSEFKFTEIVSSFQDLSKSKLDSTTIVRNGLIGNQILSRFTLLFDPINEKVYFKPRKKLNKPFKYDRSGLIIYAFGQNLKDYIVQSIIPNSPAEEAGIQVGDKIKKVGILPVGFLSLGELLQKFQRKEGKKIRLKIQRGDEIITKTLILRNLF
ncbi:MAG: PDZ domain-containing protein, partial [Bacteroidota bacterium]